MVLVGDSTLAPRTGYGDAFCGLFHWRAECVNLGRGGRSTKSYRADGSWDRVLALLAAPSPRQTWVLVQFGHNDQPGKAERSTDLATEYPANLRRYVAEIRAHGARPVLVTPLTRRRFEGGRLVRDLEPWAAAMATVAREEGVPLLDLHGASAEAVAAMGAAEADALAERPPPSPRFDRTHVGPRGAALFARLLAARVAQGVPDIAEAFVVGAIEPPGRIARPQLAPEQAEAYSRDAVLRGWEPMAPRPVSLRLRVDRAAARDERTFNTVQAAIDSAATSGVTRGRVVIQVAPGTYEERFHVPRDAPRITLESITGDPGSVRIRFRVADAGLSAVAWVQSRGFHLRNVTIENSHNKDTGDLANHSQAVALRLDDADEAHLEGVRLLGFQDTLYLRATSPDAPARAFVQASYVEGDMDFIFGEATAYFVDTEIRSLGDRAVSYVLAPSTHVRSPHGFVFESCRFTHDGSANALAGTFKLARQWNRSPAHVGKVAILRSTIGQHIDAKRPWADWSIGTPRHRPVQYHSPEGEPFLVEFRNRGDAP